MQFNWVGKLVPVKDSENFKGYEEKVYDSGWMTQKLRFNVVAGTNRHLAEINAGRWKKEEKNSVVYTYSKAEEGEKSKPIQIEWNKRNDPSEIAKVSGSRLFCLRSGNRSSVWGAPGSTPLSRTVFWASARP